MDRRPSYLFMAVLLIALSLLSFTAGAAVQASSHFESNEKVYQYLRPFIEALTIIKQNYVNVKKTKTRRLIYGAIAGMVSTLDRFSQFMTPQEYQAMQTETSGKFGGLGIEISLKNNRLTVIAPISGTPAAKAGIQAGDVIAKIGNQFTDHMSIDQAVKLLRGKVGTKITIEVERHGIHHLIPFTITRAYIKIQSVKAYLLPHDIGYVHISEFIARTTHDFKQALKKLEKGRKLKGLILDLRNDPGGLLTEAVGVGNVFVPAGKMIVSTRGRSQEDDEQFKAIQGFKFAGAPVVCLVNGGSASGAEIVSGALKDWKLATLLGERTFGKGTVQTILPLDSSGGAALRLTMAKYYTPSGVCINRIGIEPNVPLKEPDLTDSTMTAFQNNDVEKFARMLEKEKLPVTLSMKISNRLLQQLYTFCMKHGKDMHRSDLEKNSEYFKESLFLDLVENKMGEKVAARETVLIDPQVKDAEKIILNHGKVPKSIVALEVRSTPSPVTP